MGSPNGIRIIYIKKKKIFILVFILRIYVVYFQNGHSLTFLTPQNI